MVMFNFINHHGRKLHIGAGSTSNFGEHSCSVAAALQPHGRGFRECTVLEKVTPRFYSQILSHSCGERFLHGCEIKSGSGLGTRLLAGLELVSLLSPELFKRVLITSSVII